MEIIRAALLLLLAAASVAFDEEDFFCKQDNVFLPSVKVCDGVVDCDSSTDSKEDDENPLICAPAPYLHHETSLEASDLTGASVLLSWAEAPRQKSGHSLKLAGYLLTGKPESQKIHRQLPKRWQAHKVDGLNPLTPYKFILRPYYTKTGKPEENRLIGKAATVDVDTLSKDYCDLSVVPVSSSEVLITWTPLEPASVFTVTMHKDKGKGDLTFVGSRAFNATEEALSTYSILFDNLEPWTHYVAQLHACSEEKCKIAGERRILTPPVEFPHPVVTEIKSSHPGSFKLQWSFPSIDSDLYHGFRVRYCERNASTCFLAFTNETEFEAEGLANDTAFHVDVRAQLKLADGILKLGPPGRASVTTWTDVPVLMVSHKVDLYDESATSLLAWATINSSVTYFQYRLDGKGRWISCNQSTECNVTASHNSTERHAAGYMSIRHGKRDGNVTVALRGCNHHGCGKEYSVNFVWHGLEYTVAFHFRVFYIDGNALLRWSQYGNEGAEITGQCGTDWKVHYETRTFPYTRVHNHETVKVQDLPTDAEDCEFFVETYRETKGLTYYSYPSRAYEE